MSKSSVRHRLESIERALPPPSSESDGSDARSPTNLQVGVVATRDSTRQGVDLRLLLYTAPTPNGRKVSIFLEELKLTYELEYDVYPVQISQDEQKAPWFVALNPNGRIPVLVDRFRGGFKVFETAAILLYLAQHYDAARLFSFDPVLEADEHSEMLQWMFWTHGGIGPMQGQAYHFRHAAHEAIPYAQKRYTDETERLYGVLEMRLAGREYLAGRGPGKYTIADMNAIPWVSRHKWSGVETLDRWPNVKCWVDMLLARSGVQAGFRVP